MKQQLLCTKQEKKDSFSSLTAFSEKHSCCKVAEVESEQTKYKSKAFNEYRYNLDIDQFPESYNQESHQKEPDYASQGKKECIADTYYEMKR